MNAATLADIASELTADDWHALDIGETDTDAPIVKALQRHRVKANDAAMAAVRCALHDRRSAPDPEPVADLPEDLGLPVPTVEEMADEAAWWVDTFFARSLAFLPDQLWAFDNDDVTCDVLPADVRRTCHRSGMAVAAGYGRPGDSPTMRQVADALIRRMAKDGRLKRP